MATVDAVSLGYDACVAGAGLVDRSEAGKLLLSGPQAREFLDGQVSNEIVSLGGDAGRYATLLTNKGRMLADLRVLPLADGGLLLVTERGALQALFDQLRRGLIGWQVDLHKRTLQLGLLSLVGPKADEVARAAGLPVPESAEEHAVAALDAGAGAVSQPVAAGTAPSVDAAAPAPIAGTVVRTDVGVDVLAPADVVTALRAALLEAGAVAAPEAAAEIVRVERGRPRHGIDMDDGVMPEEAGIVDRAVSFKKGCYVGQETVARLHWKGKPNRHLRGLRLSAPVATGATVVAGDREVGRIGSSVVSPRVGPIALAILRREVGPGDRVVVGEGVEAEVVAPPFT